MAVADAHCTLTSDLSGIYFAVQANYEQQFVTANQQALNTGVREYKAAFAKALKNMPALLRTASATPNVPGPDSARPPRQAQRHGQARPARPPREPRQGAPSRAPLTAQWPASALSCGDRRGQAGRQQPRRPWQAA